MTKSNGDATAGTRPTHSDDPKLHDTCEAGVQSEELTDPFDQLEASVLLADEFGYFVGLSPDRTTIFVCPMNADGSPDLDDRHPGQMNWIEVTAPDHDFLEWVNRKYGTAFRYEKFAGR